MVTGQNLHYLCAVLNSALVTRLVRRIAVTTGMGLPQWDKFTVERIPVAHPNQATMAGFRDLVSAMLTAIDNDTKKIKTLQRAIDCGVYKLYEMTPPEVECVSRETDA